MNRISPVLLLMIFVCVSVQCTSARWTVTDMYALDEREAPERISSNYVVLVNDSVSVSNPILHLDLFRIDDHEYTQRVLAERTVQQYQPKWTFALLGGLGASVAFYAGNSDDLIGSRSDNQVLALNTTGAVLSLMALTHMRTSGEPIYTGETRYLRQSGTIVRSDTVKAANVSEVDIDGGILIRYGDEIIFEQDFSDADFEDFRIQLTRLLNGRTIAGSDPGDLNATMIQNDLEERFAIPVSSFMKPVIMVTSPSAELRTAPVFDDQSPLAEVRNGSELILIDSVDENWFEVQMGGSVLFIHQDDGEIHWIEEENIPTVVTVEEVPFGELSVEFAVPVLKQSNPAFGLLLNNHSNNQLGNRRYIDRDMRLIDLYLRNAFGIPRDQIAARDLTGQESFSGTVQDLATDSVPALYTYISGFARINSTGGTETAELVHLNEESELNVIDLKELLTDIAGRSGEELVVFIDLDFSHSSEYGGLDPENAGRTLFNDIAAAVTGRHDNAALIFASRADQIPGLFESVRHERKYHHIFPYYLAQAIQQRRTVLEDIVRYIESQTDYTSRRLHDRPQNIQAFGNLSINLAD